MLYGGRGFEYNVELWHLIKFHYEGRDVVVPVAWLYSHIP
jgi:hypothetical protein